MADLQYDLVTLTALAGDTPASAVVLSGMSKQLILAAAEVLENHDAWFGAGDELTDAETDAIDAAVALMESEIMTAIEFGTMAFQDADAVAISGGTIDGTSIGNTTRSTVKGTSVEANVDFIVDVPTPAFHGLRFRVNGLMRFYLAVNGTAEAGANVGSDGLFARYNDAGGFLGNSWVVTRSNGLLRLNNTIEIANDLKHIGANFGMRNVAPAVAPTVVGAKAGNVALTNLLAALAAQNHIINSTT